jgi:hypothetical protein
MEKQRMCLGCRKMFKSSSASNRFCKRCGKKRKKLSGSFPNLDTAAMPAYISATVQSRYFEAPRTVHRVYRSAEPGPRLPPFKRPEKPLPKNYSEWGPAYPVDI